MLTDLPSLEVVLLTLWKLTIITASLVFMFLVAVKIFRVVKRYSRKVFRTSGKRRIRREAFDDSAFSTAHLEQEGLSNI